jgi:arsenate reductase (glutaredoxin)
MLYKYNDLLYPNLNAMKLHPDEMFFYYDATCSKCKKTKAYAYSITNHVNEYTFQNDTISETRWRELLNLLGLRPKDLLNRAHPDYQRLIAGHTFDDEGWLNILKNYSYLIKGAIAVRNKRAILCETPQDIFKLASEKEPISGK